MGLISTQLSNGIDTINSLFGTGNAQMYITDNIQYALNSVKAQNWRLDLGYSFEVIDVGTSSSNLTSGDFSGGISEGVSGAVLGEIQGSVDSGLSSSFRPFKLQINPTAIDQQESFGINVIPTQTGVVSEHQGFVTKDLMISGTTGINPNRGAGGVTAGSSFGNTQIVPSGISLFRGGQSGYVEALYLRNYFRSYAECKKNPNNSGFRLVFHNYKDNEHWYVEPVGPGFSMSRDSSRPFMYQYTITLKIIGQANAGGGRTGLFGNILDTINNVEDFINNVSNTIDAVGQAFNGASQFLESLEKNVEITVFTPLQKASDVLKAIKNGKNTVSSLPKQFFHNLKTNITRLRDNVLDTFGLGSPVYNKTVGRLPATKKRDVLPSDTDLLDSFGNAERALNRVLASDVLFTIKAGGILPASTSDFVNTAIQINRPSNIAARPDSEQGLIKAFGGNINFSHPSSVTDQLVQYGETIERFSMRTLGDPTRYYEIVILNNLDPPYISEIPITGKKTVSSGQRLLVPSPAPTNQPGVILKTESPLTSQLTVIERTLGVDLKLTSYGDLSVNSAVPDFELIAGLNNAAQAIGIKIGVERGALLFHPQIGTLAQVGKKNTEDVENIISDIESSILSDPRFLSINQIEVNRDENALNLDLSVKIRNLHRIVPLRLNAPNVQT